jgi:hypothetical protein
MYIFTVWIRVPSLRSLFARQLTSIRSGLFSESAVNRLRETRLSGTASISTSKSVKPHHSPTHTISRWSPAKQPVISGVTLYANINSEANIWPQANFCAFLCIRVEQSASQFCQFLFSEKIKNTGIPC